MIKIIADAAADITEAEAREFGIEILPFMVHFGEKSILADAGLDYGEFYQLIRESDQIPSTSQISPADIEDCYRKVSEGGNSIIHISISSKGSGAFNTATMVANQLNSEGFDITVIDSTMFSFVIGKVVIEAARMAKEGKEKEEIISYVNETFHRDTAYFVVDDLTFLQKGGRIKATTMAISKALDIKPILNINGGLVEAYKKVRGLKKAMLTLCSYAAERMDDPENNEIYILHTDAEDKVEIVEKMLLEKVNPKEIHIRKIGPIITSHAGLGLVGIFFKHKEPYENYEKA